jgi:hypothetical protein
MCGLPHRQRCSVWSPIRAPWHPLSAYDVSGSSIRSPRSIAKRTFARRYDARVSDGGTGETSREAKNAGGGLAMLCATLRACDTRDSAQFKAALTLQRRLAEIAEHRTRARQVEVAPLSF